MRCAALRCTALHCAALTFDGESSEKLDGESSGELLLLMLLLAGVFVGREPVVGHRHLLSLPRMIVGVIIVWE
jgi:hypothetical protein